MALKPCPNCGGQVSDSADKCPHCGGNLSDEIQSEEMKEFALLPEAEKNALRGEYDGINREYSRAETADAAICKRYNIIMFTSYAGVFITMLGLALVLLADLNFGIFIGISGCVVFIGCSVVCLIIRPKIKLAKKNLLIQVKKFKVWLETEKQITYTLMLEKGERQIYESLAE